MTRHRFNVIRTFEFSEDGKIMRKQELIGSVLATQLINTSNKTEYSLRGKVVCNNVKQPVFNLKFHVEEAI